MFSDLGEEGGRVVLGEADSARPPLAEAVAVPHRPGALEPDQGEERARAQQEQRFQEMLGEQYDARKLADTLREGTARLLVERSILALEAQRMGLTVTRDEIERDVLSADIFRGEDGAFDKEQFDQWVAYEFGSERLFREQQERATLATKLMRVLRAQARVSEGEARSAVERRLEAVKIAFPVLETARIPSDFERDADAVAKLLAERDADVRALYDGRAEEFNTPEQARARHILLRVAEDAGEAEVEAVEARARELRARLAAGEEFAALAAEASDDPGSKASGGDLGYFRRGQMVPAFDAAAFSLEPGVVSEPVRTEYGFHLIRVEDRKAAESRDYASVREDLAFELLGRQAAEARARELAEQLAEAVRGGASLESACREAGLTLERTDWLRRRPDGFVPGLGAAQDLMAVAFTLEAGQSSPRIFEVGDKLALVQVLERQAPDPAQVEREIAGERARLADQKLNQLTETWVGDRHDALAEAGELSVNLSAVGGRG